MRACVHGWVGGWVGGWVWVGVRVAVCICVRACEFVYVPVYKYNFVSSLYIDFYSFQVHLWILARQ